MILRAVVLLCIVFLFNSTSIALGPIDAAESANTKPVLKAVTIHLPPYMQQNTNDGLAIVELEKEALRCGFDVDIVWAPSWSRALQLAKNGMVDVIFPARHSADRQEYLTYSTKPIMTIGVSVTRRKSPDNKKITSFDDLRGARFGVMAGTLIHPEFDRRSQVGEFTITGSVSLEDLIISLMRGRHEYVAGNKQTLRHLADKLGVADQLEFIDDLADTASSYVAFSNASNNPAQGKIIECLNKNDSIKPQ